MTTDTVKITEDVEVQEQVLGELSFGFCINQILVYLVIPVQATRNNARKEVHRTLISPQI